MPLEPSRQFISREHKMHHASPADCLSGGRCVQNEWSHQQEAASLNDALNFGRSSFPSIDGRGVESSVSMRTGQHAQGTAVRPAIIEVHSHSQHSLENGNRGLHVHDPFFLRPSREAGRGTALADGDRQILVPRHLPIRLATLVE
jgi:hypothetical protein